MNLAPLASAANGGPVAVHDDDRRRVSRRGELHVRRDATPAARARCRRRSSVPIGVTTFSVTQEPRRLDAGLGRRAWSARRASQNFRLNRQDGARASAACRSRRRRFPPPAGTRRAALRRLCVHHLRLTARRRARRSPSAARTRSTCSAPRTCRRSTRPTSPRTTKRIRRARARRAADVFVRVCQPAAASLRSTCTTCRCSPARPTAQYTLTVSNACLGTCEPPNHPPVARAKNVIRAREQHVRRRRLDRRRLVRPRRRSAHAGPGAAVAVCARVHLGAADGDRSEGCVQPGDAAWSPSSIRRRRSSARLSPSTTSLWPPNHKMVDVAVSYGGVTDNCSAASCVLTVSSNEAVQRDRRRQHGDRLGGGGCAPRAAARRESGQRRREDLHDHADLHRCLGQQSHDARRR